MNHGGQNEVGKIETIVLKHPRDAFVSQEFIDGQWQQLNYTDRPDYAAAITEYDNFVAILKEQISDVHFIPKDDRIAIDSVYVRDASLITDNGAIICNMGKQNRRAESGAVRTFYESIGIPILGEITGDGTIEGGDVVWLGGRTLVVGQGYRTNAEGIRQLKKLVADCVDEVVVVPLPHWRGPSDVFHLMSMISPIDSDLALVYSPLLPVPFREWLISRGIELIDVPDSEFETMGCNVLAVAPRRCVMLAGNPITRDLLRAAGADVREYSGDEISRKGAGGPTCLTRPIHRLPS